MGPQQDRGAVPIPIWGLHGHPPSIGAIGQAGVSKPQEQVVVALRRGLGDGVGQDREGEQQELVIVHALYWPPQRISQQDRGGRDVNVSKYLQ